MVMSMKKHKFLGNALSLVTAGALLLSLSVLPPPKAPTPLPRSRLRTPRATAGKTTSACVMPVPSRPCSLWT